MLWPLNDSLYFVKYILTFKLCHKYGIITIFEREKSRSVEYALMTSIVNANRKYVLCFIWLWEQPAHGCHYLILLIMTLRLRVTQLVKQQGQDLNPVLLYSTALANVQQDALMQLVVLMLHGQRASIWRTHLILVCKKLYSIMQITQA